MTLAASPSVPLLALSLAVLTACGGGGSGSASSEPGTLRLALTDAPACGYDHVNVTIEKIRVHQSSTAAEADGGWSEVVLSPARRVDLLTLTNGVLSELGQTALPAGKYTQMRLVLAANDSTRPLANSVVPTANPTEVALTTPSAQPSGLKLNLDVDVAENRTADLVLDFDACKSVVAAGAAGKYLLKPVVRVTPRYASGVTGFLDAALASASTSVSVQQAGVVVKATTPDSTGRFTLQPVAPGTYDVVVTSPGHASAVVTGVTVASELVTSLNTASTVLALGASATGAASGTVTTGTAPVDASVRALQTVSGTHAVEIAAGAVDPATGAYSYALPASAPAVAAYVAQPATLSFAADSAASGRYSLEARSGAATKTAGPIVVSTTTGVTTGFVFP